MSSDCALKGSCWAPEMSCAIGESSVQDCPNWKAGQTAEGAQVKTANLTFDTASVKFPWTGNVMGSADLCFLTGAFSARLLAIVGPSDAGKTSLLAAFYLLLARGVNADGVSFSGSLTLEGWENIAGNLRWTTPNGPSFPAHTSSGVGRHPGLLHLALRLPTGRCDLLAADAPGEWFSNWAVSRDSNLAEGARWLAAHADVILVIADSQALSGEQRGVARKSLTDLFRRVGTEARRRPIALVWTKCDVKAPAEFERSVKEAAARSMGEHAEFRVSMHPAKDAAQRNQGQGILELLYWIVSVSLGTYSAPIVASPERALLHAFGTL